MGVKVGRRKGSIFEAETHYVDLGKHSNTLTYTYAGGNTSTLTSTVRDTTSIVRAGINYHF
jgi:hypothetical protein